MAAVIRPDVTAFAPELLVGSNVLSDGAWEDVLAYVNEYDLSQVGTVQEERMARIFLAAHTATMVKRATTGSAGPVTGESSGNVRRSYGLVSSGSGDASLSSTRYGQLFLEVLSMSVVHGPLLI